MAMVGGSTSETLRFTAVERGVKLWLGHSLTILFSAFLFSFFLYMFWVLDRANMHTIHLSVGRLTTEHSYLWLEISVLSKSRAEAINYHQALILVENDREEKE